MKENTRMAAIQMTSNADVKENLEMAKHLNHIKML